MLPDDDAGSDDLHFEDDLSNKNYDIGSDMPSPSVKRGLNSTIKEEDAHNEDSEEIQPRDAQQVKMPVFAGGSFEDKSNSFVTETEISQTQAQVDWELVKQKLS